MKAADKGGAVVVWRTDLYQQEAFRQLSDNSFYCIVEKDFTPSNEKIVKETVHGLISKQELSATAQNLIITTPRTSVIYFKRKIHKPNNQPRPIISAYSCPTELISQYLDPIMSPFVKSLPSYSKDTNHALKTFQFSRPKQTHFHYGHIHLSPTTKDSWHSNIFLTNALTNNQAPKRLFPSLYSFSRLTAFLSRVTITSKLIGVAMGTKMGPSYTNLFVGFIEQQFFDKFEGTKPELYRRYIDDCFGATPCSRQELDYFIASAYSFHPALKYTWVVYEFSIAFLDINVSISGNRLSTSVHYKPRDSHSYLLHSLSHPAHVKNSIPFSQFLRLLRLCSDDTDFSEKAEMCQFFKTRGYPDPVINNSKHRAQSVHLQPAPLSSHNKLNGKNPTHTHISPT